MSPMAQNNSPSPLQGFSVFQSSLGAPLQFLPALGTAELDSMIDAFLPGPASIKDKRATVCMDFCSFARQTGEALKFYPVYSDSFTGSPASSMVDSGYGSSYNVSPVVSGTDGSWSQPSLAPSTSAATPLLGQQPRKSKASLAERKSSASSRATSSDFSHIPGMKIMTKDGLDITNSASRGCKTKEQRDHAHLMRIIKACDSCKKKKVRCDPSHKKRGAAQAPSPETKPAKKSKKAPAAARPVSSVAQNDFIAVNTSFYTDASEMVPVEADALPESFEESWEQFVQYEEEPVSAFPADYDFFFDPLGYLTPSSGSSTSPTAPTAPSPGSLLSGALSTGSDDERPTLPYLNPGGHGGNYIDFNLYSPASSFLDEEPQQFYTTNRARLSSSLVAESGQTLLSRSSSSPTNASASVNANREERSPCASPVGATDGLQRCPSAHLPDPRCCISGGPQPSPGDQAGRLGTATALTESQCGLEQLQSMRSLFSRPPATSIAAANTTLTIARLTKETLGGRSVERDLGRSKTGHILGSTGTSSATKVLTTPPTMIVSSILANPSTPGLSDRNPHGATSGFTSASSFSSSPSPRPLSPLSPSDRLRTKRILPGEHDKKRCRGDPTTIAGAPTAVKSAAGSPPASPVAEKAGEPRDKQHGAPPTGVGLLSAASVQAATRQALMRHRYSRICPARVVALPAPPKLLEGLLPSATVVHPRPSSCVLGIAAVWSGPGSDPQPGNQVYSGVLHVGSLASFVGLLLTMVLLFALPMRQLVDNARSNSLLLWGSVLVALGLVSVLSAYPSQLQSSGSLLDLSSKSPAAAAMSLAFLAVRHRAPSVVQYTIDNVKPKIQGTLAGVHNFRCLVTRKLADTARPPRRTTLVR